jgi:hypothetical protein
MNLPCRCVAPIIANYTAPARKEIGGRELISNQSAWHASFGWKTHPLSVAALVLDEGMRLRRRRDGFTSAIAPKADRETNRVAATGPHIPTN